MQLNVTSSKFIYCPDNAKIQFLSSDDEQCKNILQVIWKMAVFMSPTVFVCRDGPTLKILKRIGNGNPTAVWLQYGRMGRGVPSS